MLISGSDSFGKLKYFWKPKRIKNNSIKLERFKHYSRHNIAPLLIVRVRYRPYHIFENLENIDFKDYKHFFNRLLQN